MKCACDDKGKGYQVMSLKKMHDKYLEKERKAQIDDLAARLEVVK
jgi:hypothetical protein